MRLRVEVWALNSVGPKCLGEQPQQPMPHTVDNLTTNRPAHSGLCWPVCFSFLTSFDGEGSRCTYIAHNMRGDMCKLNVDPFLYRGLRMGPTKAAKKKDPTFQDIATRCGRCNSKNPMSRLLINIWALVRLCFLCGRSK